MSTHDNNLPPNSLAFIALSNEYCAAMESASEMAPAEFVRTMLRLLPRIYISASDLRAPEAEDAYIDQVMTEDAYNAVMLGIAALLGEHDTYLEVFEDDMKFSDTPIGASIAEGLTDIMQSLYNFVEVVRDAPTDLVESAISAVAEDFRNYWSRVLCNQLRALNNLAYSGALDEEDF